MCVGAVFLMYPKKHQFSKHQGLSERCGRSCGAQNLSLDSCASVEVHRGAKKVRGWAMSCCHQKILSLFRFNSAKAPEINGFVSKIRKYRCYITTMVFSVSHVVWGLMQEKRAGKRRVFFSKPPMTDSRPALSNMKTLDLFFLVTCCRLYHGKSPLCATIWNTMFFFFRTSNKQIQGSASCTRRILFTVNVYC